MQSLTRALDVEPCFFYKYDCLELEYSIHSSEGDLSVFCSFDFSFENSARMAHYLMKGRHVQLTLAHSSYFYLHPGYKWLTKYVKDDTQEHLTSSLADFILATENSFIKTGLNMKLVKNQLQFLNG